MQIRQLATSSEESDASCLVSALWGVTSEAVRRVVLRMPHLAALSDVIRLSSRHLSRLCAEARDRLRTKMQKWRPGLVIAF